MAKAKFVGNKETKMCHVSGCGALKNIKKSNRENFSSCKIAQKKGYKCCKLCGKK